MTSDSANNTEKPIALVADDDTAMRYLMQHVLEENGFSTVVCVDGEQALRAFDSNRIDMALLDVEMPGVDGYGVCSKMRSRAPNHFLPIVMVTGYDDAESVNRCYEAGATDFVSKPINWAVLGYRLQYVLRTSLMQTGLHQSEAMIRSLVKAIPDLIFRVDSAGDIIDVQKELKASPWRIAAEARCVDFYDKLCHAIDVKTKNVLPRLLDSGEMQSFEIDVKCEHGDQRHYEARVVSEGEGGALIIVRDVTEQVLNEKKIFQIAYYDVLTGLPNRRLFYSRLEDEISRSARDRVRAAVMFLDLDRFKNINDSLGHSVGDSLLIEIGKRLRDCVRECDVVARPSSASNRNEVARIGGDEFTVVLNCLEDIKSVATVANRILESVAQPVVLENNRLLVTTSIGIAVYPDDGSDAESLVKHADTAMYVAKEQGKNTYRFYSRKINANVISRITLEADLRDALEHEQLDVHYQPKIDSQSLAITGVEALVRWHHPVHGNISPLEFISVAEESGLICQLGQWVLRTACRQMSWWHHSGLSDVHVSVNVSPHQLNNKDFVESVQTVLDETRLSADSLEFEITETAAMENPDQIVSILQKFQELGVRLALDDFGTGYSSLSYLSKLPIDVLKIDKSFIRDICIDNNDATLIKSILLMAEALDVEVVAEGVETEDQFNYLRKLNPCTIQGYLFSKPLPASECEQYLVQSNRRFDNDKPHTGTLTA
ncbi:MAG: EAL domain-containing protein [Pseudomonadota bacterium]